MLAVVEVMFKGQWGAICYSSTWGVEEATVVCRKEGYENGTPVSMQEAYPSYSPPNETIWLDNVNCQAHENDSSLEHCTHDPWGTHSCNFQQLAAVKCIPKCEWLLILNY